MAQFTIEAVNPPQEGKKVGTITLVADGGAKQTVKFWGDSAFLADLKPKACADATFETIPGKEKDDGSKWPDEKFLKTWNGVARKAGGFKGGGGGRPSGLSPEQFTTEKRCITASVALKEARELHKDGGSPEDVIATGEKFFRALTQWVGI